MRSTSELFDSGENDKTHPFHYEGGQPIFDGPAQREQRATEARYAKEQEYKERQLLIESEQISLQKANFRTQVALVLFGLIGIGVNIYQAHISKISADTSKISADALSPLPTLRRRPLTRCVPVPGLRTPILSLKSQRILWTEIDPGLLRQGGT